ncbi:MAG: GNAT family N-acetyltransferase [Bacilli bacterium]|nr:GNAT family N-acetyltransferase [Bacilli bacterium]
MHYVLKELNVNMGKEEYDMYQDIPAKESGSTNECFGLPYEKFEDYLQKEINRKYNKVTFDDTPTISYIMYVDKRPIGLLCLRTEIDENWKKWSGNFYYRVRVSDRKKGYGTKMLELGLKEFRKLGFKEIYGQSSAGNTASAKVIENNGGILLEEDEGTRYYKITL